MAEIATRWYWRLLRWLGFWTAVGGVIAAGLGAVAVVIAYFILTPRTFDLAEIERANRIPGITFLDAYGDLLATRGAYHGTQVKLEELPPYLTQAFLATEDRRFYSHYGLDPRGILRAIVANIRAGRYVEGGSTITQQLAKNLFLSNDRTMGRKARELFYAVWLERHMTKDQILALYLNRIYMGAGTYGVDAASRFYFDKPASRVTLAEAAMLAGLPKAPTKLAPTSNLASAQSRAANVLKNLVEAGFLEEAEIAEALAAPAQVQKRAELAAVQYFFDFVNEMLPALVGEASDDLVVHTTLDTKLQAQAELAIKAALDRDDALLNVSQGALVAIDPSGAIRAMVGGRDYLDSQFNRASQAIRQPGSSFKPFVFLAALEHGYTPDSIVEDGPIDVGGYTPENYAGSYQGPVPLRQALAQSLNTVAVRLIKDVTPKAVIEVAQRLGITTPLSNDLSLALGSSAVTLLDMTSAFTVFASNGAAPVIHSIVKIEIDGGETLYEFVPPEKKQIVDPAVAADMTNMMFQVIHSGTGRAARLGERPAAGKTGTSQDWRDAWFVGYTGQLVAGVWVGNDDERPCTATQGNDCSQVIQGPMKRVTGGGLPANIWKDFMTAAHSGVAIQQMPGAYPARDSRQASELKSFFDELADDFNRAGTSDGTVPPPTADGGTAEDGETEDTPPTQERPKKRRWLPWLSGN